MNATTTTETDARTGDQPETTPTLYGWTARGGKKSPRLFAERWHAQRAAKNAAKRHGLDARVVEVPVGDAKVRAYAEAYGTVQRPAQSEVAE